MKAGLKKISTRSFKLNLTQFEVGWLRRTLITKCAEHRDQHGLWKVLDKLKKMKTPQYDRVYSTWKLQEDYENARICSKTRRSRNS